MKEEAAPMVAFSFTCNIDIFKDDVSPCDHKELEE